MIEVKNIYKKFNVGKENELLILKDISLTIQDGEFVAIVGASGSGKTTLMNLIGALDTPTAGSYILDGVPIDQMSSDELSKIRNKKIGFVFQTFNLIPRSTALNNVELPMLYAGVPAGERTRRAKELLEAVGMGDRISHRPNELSGGQKQRVALARALANNPSIILADEPTGALDTKTGNMVMELFLRINREEKKTVVLITHSQELAQAANRIITIRDGEIISDSQQDTNGVAECI